MPNDPTLVFNRQLSRAHYRIIIVIIIVIIIIIIIIIIITILISVDWIRSL